jgi:hypothetical protein
VNQITGTPVEILVPEMPYRNLFLIWRIFLTSLIAIIEVSTRITITTYTAAAATTSTTINIAVGWSAFILQNLEFQVSGTDV